MSMWSGKGGAWLRVTGAVLALMMLGACASPPEDADERAAFEEENDPLQDFNRYIHEVNYAFDQLVFRPISGMYRTGVPSQIRGAIRNFFDNLRSPVIFVNDLLQGEGERAGITLARFVTNSTLGLVGLIDTADLAFGLEFHDEDFGQTLAVWGVDEGIYLVLPLFGPSNPRDVIGIAVDSFLDPWDSLLRAAGVEYGPPARTILNAVDLRARNIDALDDIARTSIDYYATLRSLYRQRRADEIRNGIPTALQPVPVFRTPDEESRLMQPPAEVSRDLLVNSMPYAMSPIYSEALMPETGPQHAQAAANAPLPAAADD